MEWISVKYRFPSQEALCWAHRAGHPKSPWPGYYRGNDEWEILETDGDRYRYVFMKPGFISHFFPIPAAPPEKK